MEWIGWFVLEEEGGGSYLSQMWNPGLWFIRSWHLLWFPIFNKLWAFHSFIHQVTYRAINPNLLYFIHQVTYRAFHLNLLYFIHLVTYRAIHPHHLYFIHLVTYRAIHPNLFYFIHQVTYRAIHPNLLYFIHLVTYRAIHPNLLYFIHLVTYRAIHTHLIYFIHHLFNCSVKLNYSFNIQNLVAEVPGVGRWNFKKRIWNNNFKKRGIRVYRLMCVIGFFKIETIFRIYLQFPIQ